MKEKKVERIEHWIEGNDADDVCFNIEQAKKELEAVVDSINDIVLLVDDEGKIIRGNRAVEYYQLSNVDHLEGISFHDLFHHVCPDEKCHITTYWELARERLLIQESFEYSIFDKILKRYFHIQFRPVSRRGEGREIKKKSFSVVLFRDITSQKIAEIQLAQATAELKTLFQALPDQYIRLKWDGTILDLKASTQTNAMIVSSGSQGKKIRSFFSQETGDKVMDAIAAVLKHRVLTRLEYSLGSKNDEQFYEARFLPLMDDQIIMINENVTERKRLETIAESVDMMKKLGYIFSAIRHEIGNPINAIKMTMSVLKKNIGKFNNDKVNEYTDRVLLEINRVEYLLKSFKSFNMFEDLAMVSIDTNEFLERFVALLHEDLKEKNTHIYLHFQPGDNMIVADPRALHHVLLNIISNAVDSLKEKENRQIDIRVLKNSRKIWIEIRDNGCGLSESQQKNLFKPFFTTKTDGTGLGLVIVKKILTRMNGEIEIESTENVGTTVFISLPEGGIENCKSKPVAFDH